jgi:hypothetical protein
MGVARPTLALHKETPHGSLISKGASHDHPVTRSWGDYFAFISPTDLTSVGSVGRQVYVFSLLDFACQKGRPDLRPLAETTSAGRDLPPCPEEPQPIYRKATSASADDDVANPSVSVDGNVVAFDAFGSFNDAFTGGAANRRQVFVRNLTTGHITPVTGDSRGDSTRASLNEKGTLVVFESTAPLLGGTTGIRQVFMYSIQSGLLWQITNGAGPSRGGMFNRVGTHLAFSSTADLKGDGHDTGISQIFWYDKSSETLFQMTDGNADSRNPFLDERSPSEVYFESDATDLPGAQPTAGTQIYRARLLSGELPFIEQMTFGPGNCTNVSVGPGGDRLLFIGDGDILENGSSGKRLFALDFKQDFFHVVYQITARGTIFPPVSASLGTWFATFASDADVAATGACAKQIYLVDYDPDHYFEAGKVWLPADQLGESVLEPAPGSPDLACDDVDACTTDTCKNGTFCSHVIVADGTACTEGDQCSGVGRCEAGECVAQDGLDCDDDDACTDDTCDAETGCGHTDVSCLDGDPCTRDFCDHAEGCGHEIKALEDGLGCRADQVKPPSGVSAKITKPINSALRIVTHVNPKAPKKAAKKLLRAAKLLQKAALKLAYDDSLSPEIRADLNTAIYNLVNTINAALNDLGAGAAS